MKKKTKEFIVSIYGSKFYCNFIKCFIFSMIVSVAQLIQALYMGKIIDATKEPWQYVLKLFLIICATMVFEIIFSTLLNYNSSYSINEFNNKLQKIMGKKLCNATLSEIEKQDEGNLVSTITSDVNCVGSWLDVLFRSGCLIIKPFTTLIICFFISFKVTISLIVASVVLLSLSMVFSGKLHGLHKEEKEAIGNVNNFFIQGLAFINVVKTYLLEEYFTNKFKEKAETLTEVRGKISWKLAMIKLYNGIVGFFPQIILFTIGAIFYINGEIKLGDIIAYSFLIGIIGEGIDYIMNIPISKKNAIASIERINKVLNLQEEKINTSINLVDVKEEKNKNSSFSLFSFNAVDFGYDSETNILKNITFSICKNEKIAIVGKSGSGKSTILKLMCGLYYPTRGSINYYGQDIKKISLEELRKNVAIMSQECFLFPDSIKENVKLGKADVIDEEVITACKHAYIHDFIKELPEGYNTLVTEMGANLSLGQKQRICLARTMIQDAEVLLLDEPTSALDISTHEKVLKSIIEDKEEKTIMINLHCFADMDRFDKVLWIEDGCVVGFDLHKNLLDNPRYCELVSGKVSYEGLGRALLDV